VDEGHDLVAPIYYWLAGDLGTRDVIEAKVMLRETG